MATVRRETSIEAAPEQVWSALRDWGALHQRLAPGFVVDTQIDGDVRVVTFGSGAVRRERFVDRDEDARRLVWAILDGPYLHHNASAQVFAESDRRSRLVWIADLLPDDLAEPTGAAMTVGIATIKETMERHH
jgi:hypothetical protein